MSVRPNPRRDATEALLATLPEPASGAWLRAARTAARERLRALGLPQRRDEYWRFTDPRDLTRPDLEPVPPPSHREAEPFGPTGALRIVFTDGRLDDDASDALRIEGVQIDRLAEAGALDLHWAQGVFGTLEARAQSPVPRPLAAQNSVSAIDGLVIRVTGPASRPIHVVHRCSEGTGDVALHHVIRVEEGGVLTLLESGPAGARFNGVTEVEMADGAVLHHLRIQGREPSRLAATHLFARLGKGARMRSFTLSLDGRLTRNEAVVWLDGEGSTVHLAGATVGGSGVHHDDTVFVTHAAAGCESRQVFKKVLRAGAVGVFQGKIKVERAAQKTDGYQLAQALLLDENSQFLAKPELEIYADDVACSHGATAGAIDETALFYLRSRGVPQAEAMNLLILSFLREALDEIDDPALAAELAVLVEAGLRTG